LTPNVNNPDLDGNLFTLCLQSHEKGSIQNDKTGTLKITLSNASNQPDAVAVVQSTASACDFCPEDVIGIVWKLVAAGLGILSFLLLCGLVYALWR
jgi:hypothetical protein